MRILITGGTGLIGRQLCRILQAEGHQLTVLSRRPETVAAKCGVAVQAMASLAEYSAEHSFDAVINLAGEPIADQAWNEKRKKALRDSRVALTRELVERIAAAKYKPAVLLSASAIGFYADCGDIAQDESAPAGDNFPAKLCVEWEMAALAAEKLGVRVCLLRSGLVLSRDGGLLERMVPPFKLGMGARIGNGRQWMSWIHIDDHLAMLIKLLHDENASGPYNLTAPNPVTNAEFTATLAETLHRSTRFAAPAALIKLTMGERACLLLEGQRILPRRMKENGYQFAFETLDRALKNILG
jgi:uncharacterized protein (TIGR01777 family)